MRCSVRKSERVLRGAGAVSARGPVRLLHPANTWSMLLVSNWSISSEEAERADECQDISQTSAVIVGVALQSRRWYDLPGYGSIGPSDSI